MGIVILASFPKISTPPDVVGRSTPDAPRRPDLQSSPKKTCISLSIVLGNGSRVAQSILLFENNPPKLAMGAAYAAAEI